MEFAIGAARNSLRAHDPLVLSKCCSHSCFDRDRIGHLGERHRVHFVCIEQRGGRSCRGAFGATAAERKKAAGRNSVTGGLKDGGVGRKLGEAAACCIDNVRLDDVGLGQHEEIGFADLTVNRVSGRALKLFGADLVGCDHDDHTVEDKSGRVAPRRHAVGVSNPAQFDDHMVRRDVAGAELVERGAEAIDQAAADAAIGQFDRVAVLACDQGGVDVDLTDVVDEDRNRPVGHGEQLVDCRCLTGTEVASNKGQWDSSAVPRQKIWFLVRHPGEGIDPASPTWLAAPARVRAGAGRDAIVFFGERLPHGWVLRAEW